MKKLDGLSETDQSLIGRWIADRVESSTPSFSFSKIDGGRSNLTYLAEDSAGRRWVIRRPPLNSVLPSAHDVHREYRVMHALAGTDVPVPVVIGYARDLIGAPFYAMDYVEGLVLRVASDAEHHLAPLGRRQLSTALAVILAKLHAVNPSDIGLEGLGQGEGYGRRQIERWHNQATQLRSKPRPVADALKRRLLQELPDEQRISVVHGDYRVDNCIVDPRTGGVAAVLDWELCTLGDPLLDLAVTVSYWTRPGDSLRPLGTTPTIAEGFMSRDEFVRAYANAAGETVSDLRIHFAFAYWRLARVLEGVHGRFLRGALGEINNSEYERMSNNVDELDNEARRLLEDL